MPTFMLIAGGADVDKRSGNNPKLAPIMLERYMAWIQGLRDSGRFMGSYKLHDQTGRRLTIRGGEVIDVGPARWTRSRRVWRMRQKSGIPTETNPNGDVK